MSVQTSTREMGQTETESDGSGLDALALAGAAAIIAAAVMFLFGVFGAVGIYEGAVEMMQQWHMFFEPTVVGTIAGMVEAAVITFVIAYAFVWVYNELAR